jgi:hypothetical protein
MSDDFRIRFLIVDGEPTIRKLCLRIGESLGFVCLEAESAEAALTLLETDSPDVVVNRSSPAAAVRGGTARSQIHPMTRSPDDLTALASPTNSSGLSPGSTLHSTAYLRNSSSPATFSSSSE